MGTSSSSRFYRLPYLWGRSLKTLLFEEPPPHPNRIASLAMANSIRLLNGMLGWDQGSKPSVVPDIGCCGCSCNFLDFGQALCRLVLLLFVVVVIFVVVKFGVVFLLYCFAALFVGSCVVTNVTFTALYVGFRLPLYRIV